MMKGWNNEGGEDRVFWKDVERRRGEGGEGGGRKSEGGGEEEERE